MFADLYNLELNMVVHPLYKVKKKKKPKKNFSNKVIKLNLLSFVKTKQTSSYRKKKLF